MDRSNIPSGVTQKVNRRPDTWGLLQTIIHYASQDLNTLPTPAAAPNYISRMDPVPTITIGEADDVYPFTSSFPAVTEVQMGFSGLYSVSSPSVSTPTLGTLNAVLSQTASDPHPRQQDDPVNAQPSSGF